MELAEGAVLLAKPVNQTLEKHRYLNTLIQQFYKSNTAIKQSFSLICKIVHKVLIESEKLNI